MSTQITGIRVILLVSKSPEGENILLLESGILGLGIRNTEEFEVCSLLVFISYKLN